MPVTTVLGEMAAADLGVTLAHEHVLIDLRNQFVEFEDPEKRRISMQPLSLANFGAVRRSPYAVKDNLVLDDVEVAVEELMNFRRRGGDSLVDCTSRGINRQPAILRAVSERTGLNILVGCGYYTHDTHPLDMGDRRPEEIAAEMIGELTDQIDDSGVRAGVIGEIGTSSPIHPNEIKSLQAAAMAFAEVHAAVYVHTYPWAEEAIPAARCLIERGVDPRKIVICHLDVEPRADYILRVLELGVLVEFDNFGKEFCIDPADRLFAGGQFVQDADRTKLLVDLIERGYEAQLLITTDNCLKCNMHTYGGWGYDHLLTNIVPAIHHAGVSPETTRRLLVENPRVLLDV
jgi:phosphotriesterase-related protein